MNIVNFNRHTPTRFPALLSHHRPRQMWMEPLNVAHKMYSEGSFTKDQRGASVITSNAFIFENHIRCCEPHESINPASDRLTGNYTPPNGSTAINDDHYYGFKGTWSQRNQPFCGFCCLFYDHVCALWTWAQADRAYMCASMNQATFIPRAMCVPDSMKWVNGVRRNVSVRDDTWT